MACAVVGRPELVFLDEPTAGMDAHARIVVWELIDALRRDGVTVVLTTHQLAEAEELADRVLGESGDESERIERAWWLVLSRPPTAAERARAREYLVGARGVENGSDRVAWTSLAWALFSLNECLFVD